MVARSSTQSSRTVDPYLGYKFWVEIEGITEAVFRECTGLSVETEVVEHAEGGVNDRVHKLPGRTKFSNITLKRGWVQSDELWKWYSRIIAGTIDRRPVSIILFENRSINPSDQVCRWNLDNAFPVKWQGPEFRSDGNGIAIETLVLAHDGWRVEYR